MCVIWIRVIWVIIYLKHWDIMGAQVWLNLGLSLTLEDEHLPV